MDCRPVVRPLFRDKGTRPSLEARRPLAARAAFGTFFSCKLYAAPHTAQKPKAVDTATISSIGWKGKRKKKELK